MPRNENECVTMNDDQSLLFTVKPKLIDVERVENWVERETALDITCDSIQPHPGLIDIVILCLFSPGNTDRSAL